MRCRYCGKQIAGDSHFCNYCGKDVSIPSSSSTDNDIKASIEDEVGVLYSQDGKRLLKCANKELRQYTIKERTEIICDNAFRGCRKLEKVTLSEYVTTIGKEAYADCISLLEVIIPSSVTSIGNMVFHGCTALKRIISLNSEVPICDEFAFEGVDKKSCTLCVPKGSKKAYSMAEGWQEFKNVEEVVFVQIYNHSDILCSYFTILQGVVVAGTEEVLECGFEYWTDNSDVLIIKAEVVYNYFSAEINNLKNDSKYFMRAYVKITSGTIYSEIQTFTIPDIALLMKCVGDIEDVAYMLEDAWTEIANNYSNVSDNFISHYHETSGALDDLQANIWDAYAQEELTEATAGNTMAKLDVIKQRIEKMLADAMTAESIYIYKESVREIGAVRYSLNEALETIETDYPDVADLFKESMYNSISSDLDDIQEYAKKACERNEMTEDKADRIRAKLQEKEREIVNLCVDARVAQKDISSE